jgi:hypothetical protein
MRLRIGRDQQRRLILCYIMDDLLIGCLHEDPIVQANPGPSFDFCLRPLPSLHNFEFQRCSQEPMISRPVIHLQRRGRKLNSQFHPITTIFCGSEHESTLRTIPSFFIRKYKVERFNPKQAAAPLGPERTQLVSFSVFRMWLRSTSSRV